jgi:hypothetical protein
MEAIWLPHFAQSPGRRLCVPIFRQGCLCRPSALKVLHRRDWFQITRQEMAVSGLRYLILGGYRHVVLLQWSVGDY